MWPTAFGRSRSKTRSKTGTFPIVNPQNPKSHRIKLASFIHLRKSEVRRNTDRLADSGPGTVKVQSSPVRRSNGTCSDDPL